MRNTNPLILYMIVRTDLTSLNPGKACAQVAHGAQQMTYKARRSGNKALIEKVDQYESEVERSLEWNQRAALLRQAGLTSDEVNAECSKFFENSMGFGTCIALGASYAQLRETISVAQELGIHAGITHDPSYPLVDGPGVVHLLPLDTCGWVFGYKMECLPAVYDLKLMP